MGLYSEVINHCPSMGTAFLGVLQTKDLESILDTYWLTFDGVLHKIKDDFNVKSLSFNYPVDSDCLELYPLNGETIFAAFCKNQILQKSVRFQDGRLQPFSCYDFGVHRETPHVSNHVPSH